MFLRPSVLGHAPASHVPSRASMRRRAVSSLTSCRSGVIFATHITLPAVKRTQTYRGVPSSSKKIDESIPFSSR